MNIVAALRTRQGVRAEITLGGALVRLASLRSEHPSRRCGNAAPWKGWKTLRTSFPPFPPGLEIRHKEPDSHISTAPPANLFMEKGNKETERENRILVDRFRSLQAP